MKHGTGAEEELRYDCIVLGGGLSGLSRALREAEVGRSVLVLEAEEVGGLARSDCFGDLVFDHGPHLFRSANPAVLELAKRLLGSYRRVRSRPSILKHGQRYDFVIPVIARDSIDRLPAAACERAWRELDRLPPRAEPASAGEDFRAVVVEQTGETLYREFFGDYTEKFWGIPGHRVSAELAPRGLAVGEAASYGHLTTGFAPVAEEIYPERGGILSLATGLAEAAQHAGVTIETGIAVEVIEAAQGRVRRIVARRGNVTRHYAGEHVISTIPIVELARLLSLPCDLRFRGVVFVFLRVDRGGPLLEDSWVYCHDPEISFSRLHEPAYFSPANAPAGASSLCAEVPCFADDGTWADPGLGERVVDDLARLALIEAGARVEVVGTRRQRFAYPLYEVGFRARLQRLEKELAAHTNLELLGRSGRFSYVNMDRCLSAALPPEAVAPPQQSG